MLPGCSGNVDRGAVAADWKGISRVVCARRRGMEVLAAVAAVAAVVAVVAVVAVDAIAEPVARLYETLDFRRIPGSLPLIQTISDIEESPAAGGSVAADPAAQNRR